MVTLMEMVAMVAPLTAMEVGDPMEEDSGEALVVIRCLI